MPTRSPGSTRCDRTSPVQLRCPVTPPLQQSSLNAETGLVADDDLDVLIECGKKAHQSLDGEAFQFVVQQRGDFGLVDAELPGYRGLRKAALIEKLVDRGRQPNLGLSLFRIRKSEVGKHIAGASDHLLFSFILQLCHIFPCNLAGPPSDVFSPVPRRASPS